MLIAFYIVLIGILTPMETVPLPAHSEGESKAEALRKDLSGVGSELHAQWASKRWEGKEISSDLRAIIESAEEILEMRTSALFLYGTCCAREDGGTFLLKFIDQHHRDPVSAEDVELVRCAVFALGFARDEALARRLTDMLDESFWIVGDKLPSCPEMDLVGTQLLDSWRTNVIGALGSSGTETAIETLATGKGIPVHLRESADSALETAVYRSLDIIQIPDSPLDMPEEICERFYETWLHIGRDYGYAAIRVPEDAEHPCER